MKYILIGFFCLLQIMYSPNIDAQTFNKSITPIKNDGSTASMLLPIKAPAIAGNILGKYNRYSGIPSMYIGKVEL
jgi:hypothetical protein